MKLSKFANLVKNGGRCAVLHVAGSGIWLSTGTAIYRATELPDMEGSEQVRTVLDMTADAWKKVYLTEDWPESVSNVLGLNLAPYAQGEQDTEKLKVAAAPNGLWCSACRSSTRIRNAGRRLSRRPRTTRRTRGRSEWRVCRNDGNF